MSATVEDKISAVLAAFGRAEAKTLGSMGQLYCSTSESPIEAIFGRALIGQILTHSPGVAYFYEMNKSVPFEIIKAELSAYPDHRFGIWAQVPLDSFRLDFLLGFKGASGTWLAAVECDGHEFHERTADQATRDKSRDRKLQIMGLMAFRFTGREIWADAWNAAGSVVAALLDRDIAAFAKEMNREDGS